jgi:hypothetical protein
MTPPVMCTWHTMYVGRQAAPTDWLLPDAVRPTTIQSLIVRPPNQQRQYTTHKRRSLRTTPPPPLTCGCSNGHSFDSDSSRATRCTRRSHSHNSSSPTTTTVQPINSTLLVTVVATRPQFAVVVVHQAVARITAPRYTASHVAMPLN